MASDEHLNRAHGYETPRLDVLRHVPTSVVNVLELGCSTGALSGAIKERQAARILGVEIDETYAAQALARVDRLVIGNAEAFLANGPPPEAPFDCLIAADVLEHLIDPWQALTTAASWLAPGASIIISLPNVLWYKGLLRVIRTKSWPRDTEGVFDRTHLRWFSLDDATAMLRMAGLTPTLIEPRYWEDGRRLRRLERLWATRVGPYVAPQYILVAVNDSLTAVDHSSPRPAG